MKTELDLTFPRQYEVEELRELSSGVSREKRLYFPGATEEGGHDGVLIRVTPHSGEPWLGVFAQGDFANAVTGIYSCPDENSVCVISAGQGYVVRADNPQDWEEIEGYPVLDVRPVSSRRLLVFADFTTLLAYGSDGKSWVTSRLSSDGLKITEATPNYIRVSGWDAAQQREVDIFVDVATGHHKDW